MTDSGHTPPLARIVRALLRCCTTPEMGPALTGDLFEAYGALVETSGRIRANLWYAGQVLSACGWGTRDRLAESVDGSAATLRALATSHPFRSLQRRPAFAASSVVVLSLAVASVSTIAGIHRSTTTIPYPVPDELHVLSGTDYERGWPVAALSVAEIDDLRERAPELGSIGTYVASMGVSLGEGIDARNSRAAFADGDFARVLGMVPTAGRFPEGHRLEPSANPEVAISHRLWTNHFAADPTVVGSTVQISGVAYTVVGVMPPGFVGLDGRRSDVELWLPLGHAGEFGQPGLSTVRTNRTATAVARVPASRAETARNRLESVATELQLEYPSAHSGRGYALHEIRAWWFGDLMETLPLLLGAATVLLLLVTANLGVLHRLRAQDREAELREQADE